MRWWRDIWSLGSNWSQESRCLANLLNHGLGACPMTLLVKDHKVWSVIPKTRSVMGGNVGGNSGISEFLSLVLEPVAREQKDNMEINATNGLLADIYDLNKELEKETVEVSTSEEDWPIPRRKFPTWRMSLFAMFPVRRGAILPEGEQTGHYLWQSLAKPRLTSGST